MRTMKSKIILGIFLLVSILGIGSYFLFFRKNNNEQVYVSTMSDVIFSFFDESVSLGDIVPTLDKFGVLNDALNFSIQNISDKDYEYVLSLVDENSTIKNDFIRYQLTKNNNVVGIFTLGNDSIIDTGKIKPNEEISYSIRLWLDFKSDAIAGSINKKIQISENLNKKGSSINKPQLVDGMIPVFYDEEKMSFVKTSIDNPYNYEWYNYENGKWANVVTVDKEKRESYMNSPIGEKIDMEDINSMWVWIPRFNYENNEKGININFVNKDEKAYDAFNFNGNSLDGFWITKFEAGLSENSRCIKTVMTNECNHQSQEIYFKPGIPFMNRITMSNLFYSFRMMEMVNNMYGFNGRGDSLNSDGTINNDDNNLDIHMVLNSEWQAVAILANSIYGTNGKPILPNDSTLTGMSYYDHNEYKYNISKYGEAASTTGNIYGVYDMVGGKREFVMYSTDETNIFNSSSNSGFSSFVANYYYNNGLSASDKSLLENEKLYEYLINNEPMTRGGYKSMNSSIFSIYGISNYIDKVSLETNSRAVLNIVGGNNG